MLRSKFLGSKFSNGRLVCKNCKFNGCTPPLVTGTWACFFLDDICIDIPGSYPFVCKMCALSPQQKKLPKGRNVYIFGRSR